MSEFSATGFCKPGAGKYDDQCTAVQQETAAAGVLLMIIEGTRGNGFSAQVVPGLEAHIPAMLRKTADLIEMMNRTQVMKAE